VGLYGNEPAKVSAANHYLREDYYDLCCLRFAKWFHCDMTYYDSKVEFAKKKQTYPCYQYFYEAQFACSDDLFDFLLELSYFRNINNITEDKVLNNELTTNPNVYDTPDASARIKYTY
jgi:hypothetical protein